MTRAMLKYAVWAGMTAASSMDLCKKLMYCLNYMAGPVRHASGR